MHSRFFFLFLLFSCPLFITFGCVQTSKIATEQNNKQKNTTKKQYMGKVAGRSSKEQTLKMLIRENDIFRSITIPYAHGTKGIGYAVKGKYIVVSVKKEGDKYVATNITPSLTGLIDGVSKIQIDDLENLLNTGKSFTLIDSRETSAYQESHLPAAQSLPACHMEEHLDSLPKDKHKLLVFYCEDATCGSNNIASIIAVENGYKKVKVFKSGVQGWLEEGNKTVASDQFVKHGRLVLIDLRSEKKCRAKSIEHAVCIPFVGLAERIHEIPVHAPTVVYSDNFMQSRDALQLLHNQGIRRVAMVDGNMHGWKKRGNKTISREAGSKISWQRQPRVGEVTVHEFMNAASSGNAQIIDIRTDKEVAKGKLPGAHHIPLSELSKKLNQISSSRPLYIYSSKGARADMASRFLREKGLNAKYVLADIRCSNGKCHLVQ